MYIKLHPHQYMFARVFQAKYSRQDGGGGGEATPLHRVSGFWVSAVRCLLVRGRAGVVVVVGGRSYLRFALFFCLLSFALPYSHVS
jgi:hypothetical protein